MISSCTRSDQKVWVSVLSLVFLCTSIAPSCHAELISISAGVELCDTPPGSDVKECAPGAILRVIGNTSYYMPAYVDVRTEKRVELEYPILVEVTVHPVVQVWHAKLAASSPVAYDLFVQDDACMYNFGIGPCFDPATAPISDPNPEDPQAIRCCLGDVSREAGMYCLRHNHSRIVDIYQDSVWETVPADEQLQYVTVSVTRGNLTTTTVHVSDTSKRVPGDLTVYRPALRPKYEGVPSPRYVLHERGTPITEAMTADTLIYQPTKSIHTILSTTSEEWMRDEKNKCGKPFYPVDPLQRYREASRGFRGYGDWQPVLTKDGLDATQEWDVDIRVLIEIEHLV